ncbi:uncharacterized protein FAM241A isoform X1 [Strix uralensis]|uniref:uncharacterized protein FAM241A isoform X1 n=1 Tax=Strix uralensis TaxID=36305 RepID=UPI003DA70272
MGVQDGGAGACDHPGGWRWVVGIGVAPRLPSPQPTPSRLVLHVWQGCGCKWQEQAVSGSSPIQPRAAGHRSVPPLLLLLLLHGVGGFQPDPGSCPLSRGEMGGFWCPITVSPSPPTAGAQPQGAAAESAAEGLGRAAHAREAAGFAGEQLRGLFGSCRAAGSSDCPTSLPVPGQMDRGATATLGAARARQTYVGCRAPGRSWAACTEDDAATCPGGQPCLRPLGSAHPETLRGLCGSSSVVASGPAPACSCFQNILGSSLVSASLGHFGSRLFAAPGYLQLQFVCGFSCCSFLLRLVTACACSNGLGF